MYEFFDVHRRLQYELFAVSDVNDARMDCSLLLQSNNHSSADRAVEWCMQVEGFTLHAPCPGVNTTCCVWASKYACTHLVLVSYGLDANTRPFDVDN